MRKGFDDQLSKWIARLPFSSLRVRLLLLPVLAFLPAYRFILYSVFDARQQSAEHARENALWIARLMAVEQKNIIEVIRLQRHSLPQLPIVRRPNQAALTLLADLQSKATMRTRRKVFPRVRLSVLPT